MKKIQLKEKFKNKKGITLIALVITIIVLLILAAVSIVTLTGDNGILTKAQNASNQNQISEVEERINLWKSETTAYLATKIGIKPIDEDELLEELINEGLIEETDISRNEKIIILYETKISYAYEVIFNEDKGVNNPTISNGMIPILWNGNNWEICSQYDESWFEYSETEGTSLWANVMLSDGTYDDTTAVGTVIDTSNGDELGSMFVWIPRYSYSITNGYHTSTEGTIEIKFLKGITNIAVDGTTSWDNETGEGNWNIHPAFTFGTEELTGFWMAKFEASGTTSELAFVPNVSSLRNITISDMFIAALNMNTEDNVYEISSSDSEIDPHMTLNIEWGAVAYLTQSIYGRNGTEVTIDDNTSYYTGGGDDNAYITNILQSTTGNITGIYDLNGGAWEYIAAHCSGITSTYLTEMKDEAGVDWEKYLEEYPTSYTFTNSYYGDAIYETSSQNGGSYSWNNDYAHFISVSSNSYFFKRGGYCYNGIYAGIFNFTYYSGDINDGGTFRIVLAI